MSSNHALPATPGQQSQQQYYSQYQQPQSPYDQQQYGQYEQQPQRPAQRERAKTGFSLKSNHSRKSSSGKNDLIETHEEKVKKRLTTKADPNMAVSEQEPSAVAQTHTSLSPLRSIQHKDSSGNPIADPDRSNPTRSRWERPLDTIRSFEAAVDGSYARKSTYIRSDASVMGGGNRRSSYYASSNAGGYYNNNNGTRASLARPDSYYDNQNQYNYTNGPGGYPPRQRWTRNNSEPMYQNGGGAYPQNGYDAASGSGSSAEPLGYQTDPSSENSSFDRMPAKPDPTSSENYGLQSFGGAPQFNQPGQGLQGQYAGNYPSNYPGQNGGGPPPVPSKEAGARTPIPLGSTSGGPSAADYSGGGDKRKSWFGRRFSKN